MIKKITIIGSGVMGSGIAQSFAVSGYLVTINDIKEELLHHAQNRISENLSLLIEEGAMTDQEKQDALANITYSVDLEGAVRD
ncbi:3-hydroxyacyl-CoA dehydrogenase NAD-binding domain-containing protein, partial [Peribacillus sp. NPDC058002]